MAHAPTTIYPLHYDEPCDVSDLGVLALSLSVNACAIGTVQTGHPRLRERAVFVDQDGEAMPVVVTGGGTARDGNWKQQYDVQLHEMMNALRRQPAPRGIMLVVHGGLTPLKGSRAESEVLGDAIARDGFNPIFVNWRSDFYDSYTEHLTRVRQGQVVSPFSLTGIPAAPFYLVADLGRGLSRWPITAAAQVWDGFHHRSLDPGHPTMSEYVALRRDFGSPGQIRASLGAYCRTPRDAASFVYKLPFFPARLALAPISDAFGTSAWDNMGRRTSNLFRQPWESAIRMDAYGAEYQPGQGAAAILMDSISGLLQEEAATARPRRAITLVGHSMGTIVLNELIRLYPDVQFDHIVYMAAASSIRQFHDKVLPYLQSHSQTKFYNLTLHPNAEAREQNFQLGLPLAPGGSLLEYIDDYYAKPLTHVDRTLGKWTNVIETVHLIPEDVRGRVTLKAFGVNDPQDVVGGRRRPTPQKHGQFNDAEMEFWKSEFWEAVPPAPGAPPHENVCG